MTDFAFPALTRGGPREMEWGIVWNTQVFSSPLTQSVSTIELAGARWQVMLRLESLREADAAVFQAAVMQLRGRVHRLLMHNWARPVPRGTIAGTPLVAGAGQTGATLALDGITPGTTLLPGDFFGVNGELKMAVSTGTADGAGAMSIDFEPPLRAAPADNAAITLTRPTARFMLSDDDVRWTTAPGRFSDFAFQFIEDISA